MNRRLLSAFAVLLVLAAALLAVGAKGDDDGGKRTYYLYFDNAFGLTEGGDFKVAGVRAGATSAFKVKTVDGRPLAEVKAEVTEPGFADLRRDARCEIRPQSLIGEYFVTASRARRRRCCRTAARSRSSRPRRRSRPT